MEFSRAFVAIVKVWTQGAFRDALAASRTPAEEETIISALYQGYTDAVASTAEELSGIKQRVANILLKKLVTGWNVCVYLLIAYS